MSVNTLVHLILINPKGPMDFLKIMGLVSPHKKQSHINHSSRQENTTTPLYFFLPKNSISWQLSVKIQLRNNTKTLMSLISLNVQPL